MPKIGLTLPGVILVTVVVMMLASTWLTIVCSEEVPITLGKVSWRSYINPSRGRDIPYSLCGDRDWIYVVGSEVGDRGMPIPRIEKRLKINGSLIAIWRNEGIFGEFRDCVVLDDRLYVVGYVELEQGARSWVIALFSTSDLKPLNISMEREYKYWSEAIAITALEDSIYVAVLVEINPGDIQWHIERVSLNLSPISVYDTNPSSMYDVLMCFDINPATEDLWVVGINGLTGHWRIDVLDRDLNRKYVFEKEMPGYGLPNAIAFDENGSAYIAGAGIAVFNNRAELIQVTTTLGYCPKMAYSDGIIYLFCTSLIEGYNRHILYVVDRQSFIAFTSTLSSDINAYAYLTNGRIHIDKEHLYISGYVELEDSGGWVIYSVEKVPNQIPIEYVITEPYTTTVTVTMSFRDLVEQVMKETPMYITTTPGATPPQTPSTPHESEREPLIDTRLILLVVLLMVIAPALVYFVVKTRS